MFEYIVLGAVLVILAMVYIVLQKDENDQKLERMDQEAQTRLDERMARAGDAEARLRHFHRTGELIEPPSPTVIDPPKRRPGRPKKVI